jgi:colanic acid biosynthesis glycosyl transferase WcaI
MMLELASDLAARGWDVTVLTGFPNHPGGTVFAGYHKRLFMEEYVGPVRLWRVWLATSPRRTLFNRLLTFASFTLSSALTFLLRARPHIVFAVLQPLSVAMVLPVVARIKKARLVFNVQDLHPDTEIHLGMVRNPLLIRALRSLELHGYRACDLLTVICDPFRQHALARGTDGAKVEIVENWIDTEQIAPGPRDNSFRREVGCGPEHFIALWAGTLGHVSGAELLLDVAEQLSDDQAIRIIVVGEGPLLPHLRQQAEIRALTNLRFFPFQPRARLAEVQATADVSLITLGREFARLAVPSKILAYMAAQRAIVAAVPEPSPTANLVRQSGCGRIVPVGEPHAMAEAIRAFASSPDEAERQGRRGREFVLANRSRAAAANRYDSAFRAVLEN